MATRIVQELWTYCNFLRDDGMSYSDYPSAESSLSAAEGLTTGSEQLTYRGETPAVTRKDPDHNNNNIGTKIISGSIIRSIKYAKYAR